MNFLSDFVKGYADYQYGQGIAGLALIGLLVVGVLGIAIYHAVTVALSLLQNTVLYIHLHAQPIAFGALAVVIILFLTRR